MLLKSVSRLKFFIERQFVKGPLYQLLFIVFCVGMISLLGGALIMVTDPEETLAEKIWWAFLRLTDPGYLGEDQGLWRRIVATILTVTGYVLFLGSLVAILTQWLIHWMRELERGLTPVPFRHHFVIVGWTNRTIPIVRELILSQGRVKRFFAGRRAGKKLRMALLVEDLNPHIYHELTADSVAGHHRHQITVRSGSALHIDHLNRVGCLQAAAIIVPAVTFGNAPAITSDIETIKILLSLTRQAHSTKRHPPLVVAEIQDHRKLTIARQVYGGELEVIAGDLSISRLMAQTVRHPGLSHVYLELLSHDFGNNFYLMEGRPHAGKKVGDLMSALALAVLCGVVRRMNGTSQVMLNLPADAVIEPDDRLVLIARSFREAHTLLPDAITKSSTTSSSAVASATSKASAASATASAASAKASAVAPANIFIAQERARLRAKTVLVLGWSRKVPALLKEFAAYSADSYRLTVVSTRAVAERERILSDQGVVLPQEMCQHLEADFTLEHHLKKIRPETYDSIIVTSSERLGTGAQADARSLVAWLLLLSCLQSSGAQPQIVLELSDSHNEKLIVGHAGEILITPRIVSHLLAQVALQRELAAVFDSLFGTSGADIAFYHPTEIGLPSGEFTFAAIQQAALCHGVTALGVYPDLFVQGERGPVALNPARDSVFSLTDSTGIVVLADF